MTRALLSKVLAAVSGTLLGANVIPTEPSGSLTPSTSESSALGDLSNANASFAASQSAEPLIGRNAVAPHRVYNHITSVSKTICNQCGGPFMLQNALVDGTLATGDNKIPHELSAAVDCTCCNRCMCCSKLSLEEQGAVSGDNWEASEVITVEDEQKIVDSGTVPFKSAIIDGMFLNGSEAIREEQLSEKATFEAKDSQNAKNIMMLNPDTAKNL